MTRIRVLLAAVLVLVLVSGGQAMIRTVSLPELVKMAHAVVIAVVDDRVEIAPAAGGPPSVKTTLRVVQSLKGDLAASHTFAITSLGSLDGTVYIEDEPVFPATGTRVLLFLEKAKTGDLIVANVIQGLWPLSADGQPGGIGTGNTVAAVEAEIATQGKQ